MAYDIPDDLLQLKRDFLAADARCVEIGDSMPSSVAVVAGEAGWDESVRADLLEARSDRLRLVEEMHRHGWWATVDNAQNARMALLRAAQG